MDRTKVGRKASSACIGLFGPLAAGKGNDYVIRKESSPMPSKIALRLLSWNSEGKDPYPNIMLIHVIL